MTQVGGGSFGDLLRRGRLRAGLSQQTLAARAGLSTRAVGNLERGARTRPHRRTVDQLVRALGLAGPEADELIAAARPESAPPVPLIGRAVHRAMLAEHLHEPGLLLLTGPSGIGKTRLLDEAAAMALAAGLPVRRHQCSGDRSCWTEQAQHRVLLLDDMHRADRAAWAMVSVLARQGKVSVVAAARSRPALFPAAARHRVEALPPVCERSSRLLLAAAFPGIDPADAQQAVLLARGRPGWLLAFAAGLAAGGAVLGPDGPPLPVVRAVRAAVEELSRPSRRMLAVAALADPPWRASTLAGAGFDQSIVEAMVGQACRLGFLQVSAQGLRFTDELVRLVLGGELGVGERAELHRRLAAGGSAHHLAWSRLLNPGEA